MAFFDGMATHAFLRGRKAVEFRAVAYRLANAFWLWLLVAAPVAYFAGWWGLLPGLLAALCAFQSVSASLIARRVAALTGETELEPPE
ncbi:MAG: hypothetical protein JNM50_12015 [Chromatiales bacterium]|jgi:hypothetical protein|nr:hypothetical protein [Chromatiales bacterium]